MLSEGSTLTIGGKEIEVRYFFGYLTCCNLPKLNLWAINICGSLKGGMSSLSVLIFYLIVGPPTADANVIVH